MSLVGAELAGHGELPLDDGERTGAADDDPPVRPIEHAEALGLPRDPCAGAVAITARLLRVHERSRRGEPTGTAGKRELVQPHDAVGERRGEATVGEMQADIGRVETQSGAMEHPGERRLPDGPGARELEACRAIDHGRGSHPRLDKAQRRAALP